MVTIKDLKLEDGTFLLPREIYEKDQNVGKRRGNGESEDDYKMRMEIEKSIVLQAQNDEKYKDAAHKPFIDDVRINSRQFRALIVPATQEEYENFMREEDREQKEKAYWERCPISDGKGKIKQCQPRIPNPDYGKVPGATKTIANRCETCPVYLAWKNKSKLTSLEKMLFNDDGEEIECAELGKDMISRGDLADKVRDILLETVVDKHSRYAEIVKLILDANMNINKACEKLGMNPSGVYKAFGSKSMQEDVIEALAKEPLVEIEKLLYQ